MVKTRPLIYQRWSGTNDKYLNSNQKRAVDCSLRNTFQLIQGPPGMAFYKYMLTMAQTEYNIVQILIYSILVCIVGVRMYVHMHVLANCQIRF